MIDPDSLANEHRPKTEEEISRAAKWLAADGHSDYGIANILQANVNSIRQILGAPVAEKVP
jgi:hypothetical protein